MNNTIISVWVFSLVLTGFVHGGDAKAQPKELSDLKSNYEADVQDAIKPIRDRYVDDLQDLLRLELNRGDAEAAAAVQGEIKKMKAEAPYLGTTWRAKNLWGADSTITFRTGGKSIEDYKEDHAIQGQWQLGKNDTEVIVTRADGSVWHFELNDQGNLARKEYGGVFEQIRK